MKRVHVFYSGHVQGVGFRYSVQDVAMTMSVTGWVKNLEDRRVEVVAEGEHKALEEFLDKISKSYIGRYIKDVQVSWEKPAGEFDSFEVAF
ncbi:MAG: acylphosphatase [Candidatus Omnitrophota bacterium]|nr:acylphosphatase [Candidatus Omnitrophota bacterium]